MPEKILIIKHGALGDWILSTGVFKAIRQHHPNAHIVFLTGSLYVPLAEQSKLFDEVWVDNRLPFYKLNTLKVLWKIRKAQFTHIYDIQRSNRTHWYYRLVNQPGLYWSGKIKSCSGYFVDEPKKHIVERMALQLKASGINEFPTPNIDWLKADISKIKPESPYVLIIAGCAKHRPKKRWTAEGYAEIIESLNRRGIQSLLIGTTADQEIIDGIMSVVQNAKPINLMNQTSFAELTELARHALFILGSDTGSMHIAASTGTPSLTLFCMGESTPELSRPWGGKARTLEVDNLAKLAASEVMKILDSF